MKTVWMGLIAASALVMVGTAQASAELAASSGCMNCHMVDKKMVGPGLKDIAAKYKGDAGAPAKLTEKILKGGVGVWGPIPMPANAGVTEANAKILAQFILSLK